MKEQVQKDRVNLAIVQPSRFSVVFPEGTAERDYEEKLNQEIKQLYRLSKRLQSPDTKQAIWMRLAKAYSEKAALIGDTVRVGNRRGPSVEWTVRNDIAVPNQPTDATCLKKTGVVGFNFSMKKKGTNV